MPRWNRGYYFSKCRRCGVNLIRTAFAKWEDAKRFRGARKPATPDPPVVAATGRGKAPQEPPPLAQDLSGNDRRPVVLSAPRTIGCGLAGRPEEGNLAASFSVRLALTGAAPSGISPDVHHRGDPTLAQSSSADHMRIDGEALSHLEMAVSGKADGGYADLAASVPASGPGLHPALGPKHHGSGLETSVAAAGISQRSGPAIPIGGHAGSRPAIPDFMEEDGQTAWASMIDGQERDGNRHGPVPEEAGAGHEMFARQSARGGRDKDPPTAAGAD